MKLNEIKDSDSLVVHLANKIMDDGEELHMMVDDVHRVVNSIIDSRSIKDWVKITFDPDGWDEILVNSDALEITRDEGGGWWLTHNE